MSDLISALDNALAQYGEDVVLRRTVGIAPNQINVDVKCRAGVDAMTVQEIAAGIPSSEMKIIISPTQINNGQWPGGTISALPPFNLDQRIPRAGSADKVLMTARGQQPRAITFVDPIFIKGELVRIDMRVSG